MGNNKSKVDKQLTQTIKSVIDELLDNKSEASQEEIKKVGPEATKQAVDIINSRTVKQILKKARHVFLDEPPLLDIKAPVIICGDIHGHLDSLLCIFECNGHPQGQNVSYLFLGDYVDRGRYSIEVILLLLCYKIRYPDQIFLLRGNHEISSINQSYGFYDDVISHFSLKIWEKFQDCFDCMPLAALVDGKIFCAHGGISPELKSWEQIRKVKRPTKIPTKGLLHDLLWSDPDKSIKDFDYNNPKRRGVAFGEDAVKKFCNDMQINLIARAHQVKENGFEFFADGKLVTIFSAANYCGVYNNAAGVMLVGKDLKYSFNILKVHSKEDKLSNNEKLIQLHNKNLV